MRYTVVVLRNPEGSYTATVPALPGCIAQGDTLEETLKLVGDGIEMHIEGLIAEGMDVPKETQPIITSVNIRRPARVGSGAARAASGMS